MNWLGKLAYYASYPGLLLMSKTFSYQRARVLVVSRDGNILLVKTWFGRQRWSLPGGGIERGELPQHAAERELREETGLKADGASFHHIGDFAGRDGLPFNLRVFLLTDVEELLPELETPFCYEIIDRIWVSPHDLPSNCSKVVRWALDREVLPGSAHLL